MTRAQSMDVINGATTLESRIDAVLAAPIMEWDHSPEIQWQPGDPLWKHPEDRGDEIFSFASPVLEMPHGWLHSLPAQGGGNCPRYMFEIVGLDDYFTGIDDQGNALYNAYFGHDDTMDGSPMDCEDCLVGIGGDERHCWNCGKMLWLMTKNEMWAAHEKHQSEYWTMVWDGMQRANAAEDRRRDELIFTSTSGESGMRGYRSSYSVIDELANIEWPQTDMLYPNDFVTYTFTDVLATQAMYNSQQRLDIYDDSLYNHSYTIDFDAPGVPLRGLPIFWGRSRRNGRTEWLNNWLQFCIAAEQGLQDWQRPAEFEVPRINLRDTNPDLYRPGYERYFESENQHVPTTPGRRHHDGRSRGARHRQG